MLLSIALAAAVAAYKPEDSETLGVVPYRAGAIILQAGQFHCPAGQRRAVYVEFPTSSVWAGCWAEVKGLLLVEFEDGERVAFRPEKPEPKGGV